MIEQVNNVQNCSIEHGSKDAGASNLVDSLQATKKNVQYTKMVAVIQKKRSRKEASEQ